MEQTELERLARIEADVLYLRERMDEVVISQLKDHGKRLQALERRGTYIAGWVAGAMAFGSVIGAIVSFAIKAYLEV